MRPNRIVRSVLRGLLAVAAAAASLTAHADIKGITGGPAITAAAGATRTFNLFADEGWIMAADGVTIYSWGYGAPSGADGGTGLMQISGPTLLVNQGDSVVVNFTNRLLTPSSIMFPGQAGVTASGGTPGLLAQQVAPGQTVQYRFTALQPGTYLYQSGTQPGLQHEMGLLGALIVYPSGAGVPAKTAATRWAYGHAGTAYERENLLVVGDIDSDIHQAIAEQVAAAKSSGSCNTTAGCTFTADMSKRFPKYWTLNGRTSPDVFAKNFVGELPHQPYNTLPRVHPGERILLRMIGAGSDLHPMHHHGNNSWAIARDGRMLSTDAATRGPNLALSDYTIQVVPGQTYDAVWSWTGKGLGWDIYGATCDPSKPVGFNQNVNPAVDNCRFGKFDANGVIIPGQGPATNPATGQLFVTQQDPKTDIYKPMPVKLASEFELGYGEFYSGSPFLGTFGLRPVGAGIANTSGGFFHMFHSHNEREVVNGGIYPGGMMTMLVVEPLGVSID